MCKAGGFSINLNVLQMRTGDGPVHEPFFLKSRFLHLVTAFTVTISVLHASCKSPLESVQHTHGNTIRSAIQTPSPSIQLPLAVPLTRTSQLLKTTPKHQPSSILASASPPQTFHPFQQHLHSHYVPQTVPLGQTSSR